MASTYTCVKFCRQCHNMLYPKPNSEKELKYSCRNCLLEIDADNNCVYVNNVKHEINELSQIVTDVVSDPTLPRTSDHTCPKCFKNEAVFFQANTQMDAMRLYYVCCNKKCLHKWSE